MASPAQVANDMEARARFWRGRDKRIADACTLAARVIRAFLDGPHPDGRTVTGVLTRLYGLDDACLARENADLSVSLSRAASTLRALRQEARQSP